MVKINIVIGLTQLANSKRGPELFNRLKLIERQVSFWEHRVNHKITDTDLRGRREEHRSKILEGMYNEIS